MGAESVFSFAHSCIPYPKNTFQSKNSDQFSRIFGAGVGALFLLVFQPPIYHPLKFRRLSRIMLFRLACPDIPDIRFRRSN